MKANDLHQIVTSREQELYQEVEDKFQQQLAIGDSIVDSLELMSRVFYLQLFQLINDIDWSNLGMKPS